MKIVSVLRTGPEYRAEHAQFLHRQLPEEAVCMTDLPEIAGVNTAPLQDKELVGWWTKIELFNPDGPLGPHDLFYLDIDTLIVGDIQPLIHQATHLREMVMLSDFFHPDKAASGVMYIPWRLKRKVWAAWKRNPHWHMMRRRAPGCVGDQGFIAGHVPRILRWDEICPGKIVSYKKHVASPSMVGYTPKQSVGDGSVPADASIICYHGKPRPWEIGVACEQSLLLTNPELNGPRNCSQRSQTQQ